MRMHESAGVSAHSAAEPEQVAGSDADSHRNALTHGVRWTAAAQALTAILNFGVVIVLARMLVPADFGLLAMATAIIAIVTALQTLGTHGPLIQREEITPTLVDTVFLLNLVLGLLLMGGLMITAPWLADLYRTPEVEPLIQVIALSLVLYAFSGVPGALLYRRMQFGFVALTDTLSAILYAVVAVALAWAGYGVWSLVIAMLCGAVLEAICLLWAARFRPRPRFSWRELRGIARYSANMTGVNLLHLCLRNADSLIIGRWLGAGALGLFGMATRFTRQPVEMFVSAVLEPVLFPAYSRMQHDDALTAKTMQRALAGASVVMFPILGGMAAISRPFVEGVLGPDWSPAIVLILLMVPIGMARTLLSTVISLFLARDRTGLLFGLRLGGGLLLVTAYLAGVQVGLVGVVIALLIVESLIAAVELAICARMVRVRMVTLLAGALAPFGATLAMAVSVFAVDGLLVARGWSDPWIVATLIPIGAIVYGVLVVGLRLKAVDDLVGLLPSALSRRIGALLPSRA
jgi:PST family polysaccharide transporter